MSGLPDVDIAKYSNIGKATISRMKNEEDYRMEPKTLVKLCIGLQLPFEISLALFDRANIKLIGSTNKEFRAYVVLLSSCYELPIEDCNIIFFEGTGKQLTEGH